MQQGKGQEIFFFKRRLSEETLLHFELLQERNEMGGTVWTRANKTLTQIFAVEGSFLLCQINSLRSKPTYSVAPL